MKRRRFVRLFLRASTKSVGKKEYNRGRKDVKTMLTLKNDTPRLLLLKPDEIAVSPFQPRQVFEREALAELTESIKEHGILQPLAVRKTETGFELIAGERRLRAARAAGLKKVPCVLCSFPDEEAGLLSLIENLQRRDLDCFEEAEALEKLMKSFSLTQEEAAARLGKSQPAVANKLRLLKLSPSLRERLRQENLTERHARSLLRLPEEKQARALDRMVTGHLNVAAAEEMVEKMLTERKKKPRRQGAVKDLRLFCNTLNKAVESIRGTGLAVEATWAERDGFVEYTVRLPKTHRA